MAPLLDAVLVWGLAPLTMLAVSAAYFYASPKTQPLLERSLASSAGLVGALLFTGSGIVAAFLSPGPHLRQPMLAVSILPVALMAFSFWRFAGPRRVHLLLLPLATAMLWALVISYTVVGGGK